MAIQLSFLGAARNVTGSRYLVESGGERLLVDCGLHQERDLRRRDWEPFPVEPASIDAVLLTHAHLDHCGYLPRLVRNGFRGRVFGTPATCQIARIVLLDAAHLQEEDARQKRRRHERDGRRGPFGYEPLYTVEDAESVGPLLEPVEYEQPVLLGQYFEATFHEVGHILGATSISLDAGRGEGQRTIVFSGDVGRPGQPILRDPEKLTRADYVLIESTYGDRRHVDREQIPAALAEIIQRTRNAGGNIVIPSFAIERTHDLLYHLNALLDEDRVPHLMVFVDSPMAIRVTEVFEQHPELYDAEMSAYMRRNESPFSFRGLKFTPSTAESKAINHIRGTAVIIAGSGMCTGGRVKHHLMHNITRPECTILFVGYQAAGTLGRQITDGAAEVRILGSNFPVKARVEQLQGLSAHADQDELDDWLSSFSRLRHVFVTHGEPEAAAVFAARIGDRHHWPTSVPEYGDTVTLE